MRKLYDKKPVVFALIWIGLYVAVMNIALQVCGGFDDLETKTVSQLLVPVVCILALAAAVTVWTVKNRLTGVFGLGKFRGNTHRFLWFVPLVIMSCINLKNGVKLTAPLPVALLMAVNMGAAGYVEEVIFRGFLFRAMEKDNLKAAVIVSAVTFGTGHIVNIFNTSDLAGVLLQVLYAIVIGFLFTAIVYKGGSLWPCILSHIFVNASSVFAPEEGPFTDLIHRLTGSASPTLVELFSALIIILIAGGYALWLWKRHK